MTDQTLLHVGDILGAHGLNGALTIYSHTRPADALAGYSCWWIGDTATTAHPRQLHRCWQHGKRLLAEIEGTSDRSSAEALKGNRIWIPAAEVEVADDEYLWEELIGCEVFDNERFLGSVTALESYGAQDNLVVKSAPDAETSGEWLIPFTEAIILDVDLDTHQIHIDPPEGMDACFTPD